MERGDPAEPGEFLPTPSARRATGGRFRHPVFRTISTHALREEGDRQGRSGLAALHYFYPRPPRGGRRRTAYFPVRLR